ncbi:MAG: hypothetical protein H9W81_13695 [Enterococcus sp.]|nr:hypothetical protein [Enterococcus sp.]
MESIDGYSAHPEISGEDTIITVLAHTQSMGASALFAGSVSKHYHKAHPEVDFEDIGLEILFDCIDSSLTEEVNVTPLGQLFSTALSKLDGTTPITDLERKILTAITGSGIFVKILRDNGSRVGPEPIGVPRYRAMDNLLERAYRGRPSFETDYEISYIDQHGKFFIAERGKIDDLLDALEALEAQQE